MNMTMQSPVFTEPFGIAIIACGDLLTDDTAALANLAAIKQKGIVARLGDGQTAEYFTLFHSNKSSSTAKHLHLEAATLKYFDEDPNELAPIEDFQSVLEQFDGEKISVDVTGRFEIPNAKLGKSGLVQISNFEIAIGNLSVRQRGASFRIMGEDQAKTIDVSLFRTKSSMRVQIEFRTEEIINSGYLNRIHDSAYDVVESLLVDGGNSDGTE